MKIKLILDDAPLEVRRADGGSAPVVRHGATLVGTCVITPESSGESFASLALCPRITASSPTATADGDSLVLLKSGQYELKEEQRVGFSLPMQDLRVPTYDVTIDSCRVQHLLVATVKHDKTDDAPTTTAELPVHVQVPSPAAANATPAALRINDPCANAELHLPAGDVLPLGAVAEATVSLQERKPLKRVVVKLLVVEGSGEQERVRLLREVVVKQADASSSSSSSSNGASTASSSSSSSSSAPEQIAASLDLTAGFCVSAVGEAGAVEPEPVGASITPPVKLGDAEKPIEVRHLLRLCLEPSDPKLNEVWNTLPVTVALPPKGAGVGAPAGALGTAPARSMQSANAGTADGDDGTLFGMNPQVVSMLFMGLSWLFMSNVIRPMLQSYLKGGAGAGGDGGQYGVDDGDAPPEVWDEKTQGWTSL